MIKNFILRHRLKNRMEIEMRFSVIIPVYKVEQYIDRCITSVLKQDFNDYEILLIDDGSPDKYSEIARRYAMEYSNVKAFHKRNGGLSDARNYGIDHAEGEYIIFVDSDDWIAEGCFTVFDKLLKYEQPDVIETTLIEAYEDKIEIRDKEFQQYLARPFVKERAVKWTCCLSHNAWPAQKNIYSLSFLKKYNLHFLKGRLHEDIDWTSRIMYCAESYKGCAFPWYYHRMKRKGSITNDIKGKNITDVIEMARIHYGFYQKYHDPLHTMVFQRIMRSVYASINLTKKCSLEDREKVIKCISDNKCIFEVAPAVRYKLFVCVMNMFGVEKAIKFLNWR